MTENDENTKGNLGSNCEEQKWSFGHKTQKQDKNTSWASRS